MGLSFEMASMSLWPFRNNIPEHILRYRTDVNVDDPDQLEKAEESLWKELRPLQDEIERWIFKNAARFQGIKYEDETYAICPPDRKYVPPEFKYYV